MPLNESQREGGLLSGLLIDGHPWIGVGWYFERDIPTDRMIEMVRGHRPVHEP